MPFAVTRYEHIALDESGVPFISGTTMKVHELVASHLAYGWSPEELCFQYPHLTMGQIYSALAYYADHREEIDRDIEHRLKREEQTKEAASPSPLLARLESQGRL